MRERKLGIDVLKITATLMVVVLHVNGYLHDTVSFENFSFRSLFLWHSLEAFAYPAIHLFVMITAYLSLDKKNISIIKSGAHTWMQTIIICICGLVIAIAFRIPYSYKDMFSCVFPFLGRAYWYVSDILVFLILIPVLNNCLKNMSTNQLKYLTAVLFCLISIFPTFLFSLNWKQDYSNIGLFILLYFVVALIKRLEIGDMKIGGGIWFLSYLLLFCSWLTVYWLSKKVSLLIGREMMLFQYCSPLVIGEAVGVFILCIGKKKVHMSRMISTLANASLAVYLIHMHPIFKSNYIQWSILGWIDVSNPIAMELQLTSVVLLIYGVGVMISIPLNRLSTHFVYLIKKSLNYKNNYL